MKPTSLNTNIRWVILLFLFFATVLLYIDRSALGIMAPFLQKEIGWNEQQYGHINTAFMIGYALCFLIMGALVDKIGTKAGYTISVGLWALAQASTVLARSWIGFALVRAGLSIGQSGNFPVANKVLCRMVPKKRKSICRWAVQRRIECGDHVVPSCHTNCCCSI